MNLAN
jgi:hypothetical protein